MNPFNAKFSPEFPCLLHETGGSIMLSTYLIAESTNDDAFSLT